MEPLAPIPDPESAPYWEAAADGRLLVKRCSECGRNHWYPRDHCPHCQSAVTSWEETAGRGTIYSWTTVRRPQSAAFADRAPYSLALVELEEGPRVLGFLGDSGAAPTIGAPVEVSFEPAGSTALPVFHLVEPAGAPDAG